AADLSPAIAATGIEHRFRESAGAGRAHGTPHCAQPRPGAAPRALAVLRRGAARGDELLQPLVGRFPETLKRSAHVPPAMEPGPLPWRVAYPLLDNLVDHLHGCGDVHFAVGPERRIDPVHELD